MAAIAMTPPPTPPAMAPVFSPLPEEMVDTGEADAAAEEEALEVELTLEEADVPINAPGRISGVSEERRSIRREP